MITIEQDKTMQALQLAIEMEKDGKDCYLKAGKRSGNEVGKKLLESLVAEEDAHLHRFEEIYNAIRDKKGWPTTNIRPGNSKALRDLFAKTCEMIGVNVKALTSEISDVKTAMDKENKSQDFYRLQSKNATYEAERYFYETLTDEEREHGLILLDYYEYLTDPAEWFVNKEHSSLDG